MKLRRLALCLVLALTVLILCVPVSAGTGERIAYPVEGGNLYFDPNSGTITDCDHSVSAAVIPQEIGGVAVTSIGDFAFDYCDKLNSVTIPYGVETVGRLSFAYCYGLTSIVLPDSLTTLADKAFFDCTALSELSLGGGITSIGRDAFWGTAYLRHEENWENDLLYAGDVLLSAENTLAGDLRLPENTRVIAGSAFYGCTGLTEVIFPEGLISIGPESFYYCISLTELEIPDHVIRIEDGAFQHCAALQEAAIGSGVCSIGEKAFAFCGALERVIIGKGLETVGSYAFSDCDELTEIRFYGTPPILGEYPFDCYSYTESAYTPTPGLTLYYTENATGWESPLWQGYLTALWRPSAAFDDVLPGSWYEPAVDFVVSRELMQGMGQNRFAPDSPMTRAMLVTVLWRYAGEPAEGTPPFADVPDNVWYTQAVAWAVENNVVNGVGNNRFDPDGRITREQLAVILYRYSASIGIDTGAGADLRIFPDAAEVSPYAAEALAWAVDTGLITGSATGGKVYLAPQGHATRAQVATILMRFIQNIVE